MHDLSGPETARAKLDRRAGHVHDPALTALMVANASWLTDPAPDPEAALGLEPLPHALADPDSLDAAFLVLADVADLRLAGTHGHSRRVAALCAAAGKALGLTVQQRRDLRLAALAHDIGELALATGIRLRGNWSRAEAETHRQHPRTGARLLDSLAAALPEVLALVDRHHERLDGSGGPRGLRAADLSLSARILAAAEALASGETAAALRDAIRGGALCPIATEAVLTAAGEPSRRATPPPGLTPRETEVLRALCQGQTTKEAARALGISPKTADHHIQSLYGKIGARTRAGAVLWAMERGLAR